MFDTAPCFDEPLKFGTNSTDTKLGYWSTAHLLQPSEAAESIGLLIQPENNASESTSGTRDIVTVYYGAENKMTTFQYAHIKSTGFNIEITERDLSQVQMVRSNKKDYAFLVAEYDELKKDFHQS